MTFPSGNYQTLYCFICSPLNFVLHASSKIMSNYFQKELKKKTNKTPLNTIPIVYLACLQKRNIHGQVLSIRVVSGNEH